LSETLKCDSALPFFIPIDDAIPPYTECIAMKYGWIWKIPLQDRYGCGYVFDSSFISEAEAAEELEEMLGFEPTYPRKNKGSFKFKAGYYSNPWINNCVAVGLSSGFVEPLEATAIGVIMINLSKILSNPWRLANRSKASKDTYNRQFSKLMGEIGEFLYLHYMTGRTDSEFWLQFKDKKDAPLRLQKILDLLESHIPDKDDFEKSWEAFEYESLISIVTGIGLANVPLLKEMAAFNDPTGSLMIDYKSFKEYITHRADQCVDHNEILKYLGGLR